MGKTTMKKLLQADEAKVRKTIQTIEKDRKKCIENLSSEFDTILNKYKSAYPQDKMRQSAANACVSVVCCTFDMLTTVSEKKEDTSHKEQNNKVPIFAIIAAILCMLTAILIITKKMAIVGVLCLFASVIFALLSDKIGGKEEISEPRESGVTIDSEMLWNTLVNITGIMDEKIEEFLTHSNEYIASQNNASNKTEIVTPQDKAPNKEEKAIPQNKVSDKVANAIPQSKVSNERATTIPRSTDVNGSETLDDNTLQMFGYLLETLYFWDGVHAHNQLKNIRTYLKKLGIELMDYDGSNEDMFEFVPSRNTNKTSTIRPAMLLGDKLLMPGYAVKPDVRRIFI